MAESIHRVVVLAMPGVVLLDLAAPVHLFGHCGAGRYELVVAGEAPGPVVSSTGLPLHAEHGLEAVATADTVVVPGFEGCEDAPGMATLQAVRAAHDRGARVMSICTGAYVLAHAGLLDGRRATTHWWSCAELAQRFPAIDVDPDVLYIDEGQVLTSAGVASGLDLCLHVVRRDHGADVAAQMARRTVVAPHRDGGQAQFVQRPIDGARRTDPGAAAVPRRMPGPESPVEAGGSDGAAPAGGGVPVRATGLAATRAWALERLDEPLDVARLAAHANVSPRTFARRFREETGTTPAQWILGQRVAVAQSLLERTDLPVEEVALQAGFGTAASLREHLGRRARTTPTAYRRAFRTTA